MKIVFTHPQYLWILLALPLLFLIYLFVQKNKKSMALRFANFEALEKVSEKSFLSSYTGSFSKRRILLLFSRTITYSLFILAISGATVEYYGKAGNFDFVLAIDSSPSMLANDFEPSRLEAAKEVALLFVDSVAKSNDIGIVSFAGDDVINLKPSKSIKQAKEAIRSIKINKIGGTNIGGALITSANLFEEPDSKRIILLTDGQATIGTEPADAIDYLNSRNITVYTIGVATASGGNVDSGFVSKLGEETLKTIAEQTGGSYYEAENKGALQGIFAELASSTEEKISFNLSGMLLISGFVLLALVWVLTSTKYRVLP